MAIVPNLTPQEFISLAQQNKIRLIDRLGARLLELGEEYALCAAEYYQQKLAGPEHRNMEEFARLTGLHSKLEIEWDALKHAVSALQSTLKAERENS